MSTFYRPTRVRAIFYIAGTPLASLCISTLAWSAPPVVNLPDGPIASTSAHPNFMIDVSVEFPTVATAYPRSTYVPETEYVGYFDPKSCYVYPTGSSYANGKYDIANDTAKRFLPKSPASSNHSCKGAFSGNFMNWVASSAIDILRLTLSGGYRVVDQVGKTYVQRANLPVHDYAADPDWPLVTFSGTGIVKPSDVTPFSASTIYVTSCRNRVLFSDKLPTPLAALDDGTLCDAEPLSNPDKNLGEYLVQVEVCSTTEGPTRPDYCVNYSGNFKPEGLIQKNADKLHFGVMGYLLDSNPRRYGGMLRAPMKYVGRNAYDAGQNKSINPFPEWDSATGEFFPDPIGNPSVKLAKIAPGWIGSGVINALNTFGSNGIYKKYDPVGELLYESVRYLQGLQPTPEAVQNITTPMLDNFQAITKWVDPIIQDCQKTSIFLIADANTNFDFYIPGNTRTIGTKSDASIVMDVPRAIDNRSVPPLDVMAWTRKIGEIESVAHGVDSTTRSDLANLDMQYAGSAIDSFYPAGVAYWANVSELRPDRKQINAQTYVMDVDQGGDGSLEDTNTRIGKKPRSSQLYLAAKYGAFIPNTDQQVPHDPLDPFWPIPTASSQKSAYNCYSYLWDLNGNCNPDNFFLATDGRLAQLALRNVFAQQALSGDAVASVTASSAVVADGTTQYIYQGKFFPGSASGDLRRFPVTYTIKDGMAIGVPDGNTPTVVMKEPDWPGPSSSASKLSRKIVTLNAASTPVSSAVPFQWSNLTPAQQAMLNGSDMLGEDRLHYLRGSTNKEYSSTNLSGLFRARPKGFSGITNLLGDIINSSPVFVGAPSATVQGANYRAFFSTYQNRAKAVYVGANDGMLHAFSPDLSQEYFAYVPAMIIPGLIDLTSPTYGHRAYVDGAIAVAEAKVGNSWKTVLAATLGKGAQGVIALDVTDPANFSTTSGALWEFSDADDADMGNGFSAPTIAKILKQGTTPPVYEYYVVVTSGVNNYVADKAVGSAPGGALFLLRLDKAPGVPWTRNTNYFKYPIASADISLAAQSGLSAPGFVNGSDGALQLAYAGDLQGNLWRFAFPSNKALSTIVPFKLFTATDTSGLMQPITAPPSVVYAPDGGYVVLFGTGKYLEIADLTSTSQQSFYGIRDKPDSLIKVKDRTELAKRTLTGAATDAQLTLAGASVSYLDATTSKGWYVDFTSTGNASERSVAPAKLGFGQVFFNTLTPASCPNVSGGRSYAVGTLTGLAEGGKTGLLSNVGILSTPLAFITQPTVAESVTPNAVGRKVVAKTYSIVSFGTRGLAPSTPRTTKVSAGRLSWREVFNYQGLRNGK